jgi:hypothetical protein
MSQSENPPAFPVPNDANVNGQEGMALLDYFAAHAPIQFDMVVHCYGGLPNFADEFQRNDFIKMWAALRYDYANAMLGDR